MLLLVFGMLYICKKISFLPSFLPFSLSFFPLPSFSLSLPLSFPPPSPPYLISSAFINLIFLVRKTNKQTASRRMYFASFNFWDSRLFKKQNHKTRDSALLIALINHLLFKLINQWVWTWFYRDGHEIGQLPNYNSCSSLWHQVLKQPLCKQTGGIRTTRLPETK